MTAGEAVKIEDFTDRDWDALRAEYIAGGIGQRALAEKHGIKYGELKRRAGEEKWTALRDGRIRDGRVTEDASDTEIALRVRRQLLMKLEKMAEAMPTDAVTERKSQDDSAVSLFKLRDLTAAFKEVTGDLGLEDEETEQVRVIIDP